MKSIAFPNFLRSTSTDTYTDHEATASNLKLLLKSDKGSLFGDPYFGTNIKKILFEQNSIVTKDLIIDDSYTAIRTFMPQIKLTRNDINITSDKETVYENIDCFNLLDYSTNLYTINITNTEE